MSHAYTATFETAPCCREAPPPVVRVGRSLRGSWHLLRRDGRALCGSRARLVDATSTRLPDDPLTWLCARCLRLYLRPGKQGQD